VTSKTLRRVAFVLDRLIELCVSVMWMDLGACVYAQRHGGIPNGLFILAGILGAVWLPAIAASSSVERRIAPNASASQEES
jgi:hypothetical protein